MDPVIFGLSDPEPCMSCDKSVSSEKKSDPQQFSWHILIYQIYSLSNF